MLPRRGPTVGLVRTPSLLVGGLALTAALSACSGEPALRRTAPGPSAPSASTPSASPATSTLSSATPAPATTSAAGSARLIGDGIETPQKVLTFGDSYEQASPALTAALGPPTKDTGLVSSFSEYGTCPGTRLRVLEFGNGALRVLFGDVPGPGITMYQWSLAKRTPDVPRASALIGDVTTYEFGVGDSVAELRAGIQGGAELKVNPGDETFGPSFTLTDQSSGFFGFLTGTGDRDTVTEVQAGEGCGE
jgi:hypothetical protein